MHTSISIPQRVKQIAKLIGQMDADERRWLLQLVPDLQPERLPDAGVDAGANAQRELYAYFEPRLKRVADARPMTDDDVFIGGLSVGQFFALPDEQQLQFWNQAHVQAERDLKPRERDLNSKTHPTR